MAKAMDGVPFNSALLERLAVCEGPAAQRALFQALEAAQDSLQAAVLHAVLKRGGAENYRRIARLLPALGGQARRSLYEDIPSLEEVARLGLQDSDASVRVSVVNLLDAARQPACAYLLSSAITDTAAAVRTQAAKAMRSLVSSCKGNASALAEFIAPAVGDAIKRFSLHQLGESIQCAIMLGVRCPEDALRQMDRPASRMSGPLSEALRAVPPADSAEFVLSSLMYHHIANVTQSFISNAPWSVLAMLAAKEHWLALQSVAKALAEITYLRAAAEDPSGLGDLPEKQQGPVLRLAMACGISETTRDMLLGQALGGEALAAKAAMPFLVERRSHAAETVLMALHSRYAEVQTVAAARIIAGGTDMGLTEHLLEVLPNLEGPIRSVVSQYVASDSFERYWANYRKLGKDVRQAAGKALLKLDKRVVELLASRLASRDINHQIQAIQMVRQLKMVAQFENSLCHLARHGDKTVRSAAAAALGEADTLNARSTLTGCLHDTDTRVQANAVEALSLLGDDPSIVLDKVRSLNNRVRANAIKWLLQKQHNHGELALAEMLTDSRTPHRVSALWVAKSLHHTAAAGLLDRMALRDEDPKVRARAATILREWKAAQHLTEARA